MSTEAMKQALDALSYVMSHGAQVQIAKDILTQAIEQADKPVAWATSLDFDDDDQEIIPAKDKGKLGTSNCDIPLYTAPPKKEWVEMTEERLEQMWESDTTSTEDCRSLYYFKKIARQIEAKLKEKNT